MWQPVNCYKNGNTYYHVYIRDTWLCRECGYLRSGQFIMPMIEHDEVFYAGTDASYPEIPAIFQKIYCQNCGKEFQKHFVYKIVKK